jgi:hypothetical protein
MVGRMSAVGDDIGIGKTLDPEDEKRFKAVLGFRSPIIQDGFAYWQSKCPPGGLPRRADISPFDIPRILPHIVLLDVVHDPRDFCYRVIGTSVVEYWTKDWTGACMSGIAGQGPTSKIWDSCDQVVTSRRPLLSRIPYVGPRSEFVSGEDIILPLVDEVGKCAMLLVFVAYIRKS